MLFRGCVGDTTATTGRAPIRETERKGRAAVDLFCEPTHTAPGDLEIWRGAARVSPLGLELGCGEPGPAAGGTERWRSDRRGRMAIAPH